MAKTPTPNEIRAQEIILGKDHEWVEGDQPGTLTITLPDDLVAASVTEKLVDISIDHDRSRSERKPTKEEIDAAFEALLKKIRDASNGIHAEPSADSLRVRWNKEIVPGHVVINVDEHLLGLARQVLKGRELGGGA